MVRKYMDKKGFEFERNTGNRVFLGVQLSISCEGLETDSVINIMESVDREYNRILSGAIQEKDTE